MPRRCSSAARSSGSSSRPGTAQHRRAPSPSALVLVVPGQQRAAPARIAATREQQPARKCARARARSKRRARERDRDELGAADRARRYRARSRACNARRREQLRPLHRWCSRIRCSRRPAASRPRAVCAGRSAMGSPRRADSRQIVERRARRPNAAWRTRARTTARATRVESTAAPRSVRRASGAPRRQSRHRTAPRQPPPALPAA